MGAFAIQRCAPFTCRFHSGFSHPGTLRKHKATHEPKSLECTFDGCGKKFRLQQHLSKHRESHTNPKTKKAVGDGKTYITSTGQLGKIPAAPPDSAGNTAKKPRLSKKTGKTVGTSADLKVCAPPVVAAVSAAWTSPLPENAPKPKAPEAPRLTRTAAAPNESTDVTPVATSAPPPPGPRPAGTTAARVSPASVAATSAAAIVADAALEGVKAPGSPKKAGKAGKTNAGKTKTGTGKVGKVGKPGKAGTDMAQLLAVVGEEKKTA